MLLSVRLHGWLLMTPNDLLMTSECCSLSGSTGGSKRRMPALTWRHPVHGAVICRSSQPLTGLQDRRCHSDEELLQRIVDVACVGWLRAG